MDNLKHKIRTIPDYPKPGIKFSAITTLLADPKAFKDAKSKLDGLSLIEAVNAIDNYQDLESMEY